MSPEAGGGTSGGHVGIAPIEPPFTVRLAAPIPRGVPAGGVFQHHVDQPNGGDGGELSPDSIAVDSSSLVPTAAAPQAIAVALHSVGLAPAAGPVAGTPLAIGVNHPATSASAARGSIDLPGGPGAERAELPDLSTLDPTVVLIPPEPNDEGSGRAGRSADPMNDDDVGEGAIAGTRRNQHRLTVMVATYGAASLILGVSSPGLIAAARSRRWRNDPESTHNAEGRDPLSPS
jgi:hypothetical protein